MLPSPSRPDADLDPVHLRRAALAALAEPDPANKAAATRALWAALQAGAAVIDAGAVLNEAVDLPGRPALPRLVPAGQVPTRSPFTLAGRAALLHAICHIEFNAIKMDFNEDLRFAVHAIG